MLNSQRVSGKNMIYKSVAHFQANPHRYIMQNLPNDPESIVHPKQIPWSSPKTTSPPSFVSTLQPAQRGLRRHVQHQAVHGLQDPIVAAVRFLAAAEELREDDGLKAGQIALRWCSQSL